MQDQVAVVQLDLSKEFDRVNHQFLFELLRHVNVRATLLDDLKLCYRSCVTRLAVNRALLRPITLNSSVKQSCPRSPLLVALYLEPPCRSVIKSSSVIGYRLLTIEVRALAYANGVAFFAQIIKVFQMLCC